MMSDINHLFLVDICHRCILTGTKLCKGSSCIQSNRKQMGVQYVLLQMYTIAQYCVHAQTVHERTIR